MEEERSKYEISLSNLKNKEYSFHFKADSRFFTLFEQSLTKQGAFEVALKLVKSETMIRLLFHIHGTLVLVCDRSLEEFEYPFNTDQNLILKYGTHHEEITEELEIIEKNTTSINVAQYIYEFVMLSIPVKKLHPKFKTEEEDDEDTPLLVYSSGDVEEGEEQEDKESDVRWNALKNLKSKIDKNKN